METWYPLVTCICLTTIEFLQSGEHIQVGKSTNSLQNTIVNHKLNLQVGKWLCTTSVFNMSSANVEMRCYWKYTCQERVLLSIKIQNEKMSPIWFVSALAIKNIFTCHVTQELSCSNIIMYTIDLVILYWFLTHSESLLTAHSTQPWY